MSFVSGSSQLLPNPTISSGSLLHTSVAPYNQLPIIISALQWFDIGMKAIQHDSALSSSLCTRWLKSCLSLQGFRDCTVIMYWVSPPHPSCGLSSCASLPTALHTRISTRTSQLGLVATQMVFNVI
jgi:hypothetical protein